MKESNVWRINEVLQGVKEIKDFCKKYQEIFGCPQGCLFYRVNKKTGHSGCIFYSSSPLSWDLDAEVGE